MEGRRDPPCPSSRLFVLTTLHSLSIWTLSPCSLPRQSGLCLSTSRHFIRSRDRSHTTHSDSVSASPRGFYLNLSTSIECADPILLVGRIGPDTKNRCTLGCTVYQVMESHQCTALHILPLNFVGAICFNFNYIHQES